MEAKDVRIVNLPAMKLVCFNGFGRNPENQAWDKLKKWAREKGQWDSPHRFFGYNDPDPSPGSPNYGYAALMTVEESIQPSSEIHIVDSPGGLYAVFTVHAGPQGEGIFEAWQELNTWVENSQYRSECCKRQWLEESMTLVKHLPDSSFILDLHLPISE
jgi:DNA gyrase inhibitor GyrI